MIKFFQKLKAKKGFTLVELIVVIAIIGVLAAILIPTMLGYVTSSRVTSANSTAASLKNSIDNFLTDADTAGYGMKQSSNAVANINGSWDASGTLKLKIGTGMTAETNTSGTSAFKSKAGIGEWLADGSAANDTTKSGSNATQFLAIQLKSLFPDLKGACFSAHVVGGKAMYLAYTADTDKIGDLGSGTTEADFPSLDDFQSGKSAWNTATAGVSSGGLIIGTAPALTLSVTATT